MSNIKSYIEKPLVVILALSDLSRDPRVMRQILWLREDYNVLSAGFFPAQDKSIKFVDISQKISGRSHDSASLVRLRRTVARVPGMRYFWTRVIYWRSALNSYVVGFKSGLRRTVARVPGMRCLGFMFDQGGQRSEFASGDNMSHPATHGIARDYSAYFIRKLGRMCDFSPLSDLTPDLVVANDLDCLVLAEIVFKNVRVVFDAHEYAPLEYNSKDDHWVNFEKPARIWACQNFLPAVSGMSTVCNGIAAEFVRNFVIPCPVEVITNAPLFEDIRPHSTDSVIQIVHHGIGSPIRKIELMAEAVKLLGNKYELNLILVEGDLDYINGLKLKYGCCENIKFLDPVPMPEIARYISRFDVGIFILEPDIFNYEWALPNKFFEFIQARLAIAVGPSPEMSRIVRDFELGVVSTDFTPESMANALARLSPGDIDYFKGNSDGCAKKFCGEANREIMLRIVEKALRCNASARGL